MISIQFLRSYGAYKIGDIAGFPATIANQIISAGVAKPFTAESPAKAPPPQPVRRGMAEKMIKK